jgi:hypothetical protein
MFADIEMGHRTGHFRRGPALHPIDPRKARRWASWISGVLYFLEVTTAAFVALTLSDFVHAPERRGGLVLALAIAMLAGGLAGLAETVHASRDRRAEHDDLHRREMRRQIVERARS